MCERRKQAVATTGTSEACERCAGCRLRVVGDQEGSSRRREGDVGAAPVAAQVECGEHSTTLPERLSA
jgi:hypothetical protein